MEAVNEKENTTSGATVETEARPSGAATSRKRVNYQNEPGAATGRITKLGTGQQRLAILVSELVNCQNAGVKVRWMKSQTKPRRILLAIYDAEPCPKCGAFLLVNDAGMVKCTSALCDMAGVEYAPDELPDRGHST